MNALAAWSGFFVAQASAAAALTGLIFVVLSFNFDHIVGDAEWLGRAGTGLILLAQPVVFALIALFPGRTALPLAVVLSVVAVGMTATVARIVITTAEPQSPPGEMASRLTFTLSGSACAAVGAVGLAAGWTGGAYLLAAGALVSTALGLVTAWVLLVEVRRSKTAGGRPEPGGGE